MAYTELWMQYNIYSYQFAALKSEYWNGYFIWLKRSALTLFIFVVISIPSTDKNWFMQQKWATVHWDYLNAR